MRWTSAELLCGSLPCVVRAAVAVLLISLSGSGASAQLPRSPVESKRRVPNRAATRHGPKGSTAQRQSPKDAARTRANQAADDDRRKQEVASDPQMSEWIEQRRRAGRTLRILSADRYSNAVEMVTVERTVEGVVPCRVAVVTVHSIDHEPAKAKGTNGSLEGACCESERCERDPQGFFIWFLMLIESNRHSDIGRIAAPSGLRLRREKHWTGDSPRPRRATQNDVARGRVSKWFEGLSALRYGGDAGCGPIDAAGNFECFVNPGGLNRTYRFRNRNAHMELYEVELTVYGE